MDIVIPSSSDSGTSEILTLHTDDPPGTRLFNAGRVADIDTNLVAHASGCDMAFCKELKKALTWIANVIYDDINWEENDG